MKTGYEQPLDMISLLTAYDKLIDSLLTAYEQFTKSVKEVMSSGRRPCAAAICQKCRDGRVSGGSGFPGGMADF